MRVQLSRRQTLLQAIALAAAGAASPACSISTAAPLRGLGRARGLNADLQASIDAAEVPGIVAMAATKDSIIYEGAFGRRDIGATVDMSTDTVFKIASMVKLVTSIAALQLVEAGKLKLDEPAAKIDPTLISPRVLTGFDAHGVPILRGAKKPITLRNLLSHTSGFSYQLWDSSVARYLKLARTRPELPRMPLAFDPGSGWAYGSSLDRVGRLIEIASGKKLDHYFQDHILGPLGMADTAFALTEAQSARRANLHLRAANGSLVAQPLESKPKKKISGGGNINSTAPDYLKLLQAMLNDGRGNGATLLRAETVQMMAQNQIGDLKAGIMKTTNPALSSDVDFFPGNRLRWGLGHMINLDPVEQGRRAGSLTWAGLYNTYYWIDPASGIAGVIMMQILPFADQRALNVYRQFERGIYRSILPG
jgi:CubicO group peptidase (beta-lactamase class C family)